jgi:hypothetical protein
MTKRRIVVVALVALAVLTLVWYVQTRPGRTLYVGGPILTMDADNRVVDALAVDGERIVGVGSEAELRDWATARRSATSATWPTSSADSRSARHRPPRGTGSWA